MAHVCDRDSCPTANVTGPKTSCIKCKKVCYLLCYGAERSSTGMLRFKLQKDLTIYVETANAQVACGVCVLEGNVAIQTKIQLSQKTETKESGEDDVTNAQLMEAIKTGFMDLKEHINVNVEKNQSDVKQCINEISETVKKASTVTEPLNGSSNRPLYSSVLRSKRKIVFATPASIKRKRTDENGNGQTSDDRGTTEQLKTAVPKPMLGRSAAVIGQKPKAMERRLNGFEKSLRVGGLDPSVTVDVLCDYIVKNTSLTDKSKFRCTMLVKRGQNLSELSYVSAKVDVSPEDYDLLTNMDLWPNYVTVREFVRMNNRNQRQTGNDEMNPNKFQRINDVNVDEASTSSTNDANLIDANSELGFREGEVMDVMN